MVRFGFQLLTDTQTSQRSFFLVVGWRASRNVARAKSVGKSSYWQLFQRMSDHQKSASYYQLWVLEATDLFVPFPIQSWLIWDWHMKSRSSGNWHGIHGMFLKKSRRSRACAELWGAEDFPSGPWGETIALIALVNLATSDQQTLQKLLGQKMMVDYHGRLPW